MGRSVQLFFPLILLALTATPAHSQEGSRFRFDAGFTYSRFEQQVKTEIGGARGQRLVEQSELGAGLIGTYRFWGPISGGLYGRYDVGSRSSSRFTTFGADGVPQVEGLLGGDYSELWLGPSCGLKGGRFSSNWDTAPWGYAGTTPVLIWRQRAAIRKAHCTLRPRWHGCWASEAVRR